MVVYLADGPRLLSDAPPSEAIPSAFPDDDDDDQSDTWTEATWGVWKPSSSSITKQTMSTVRASP